MSIDSTSKVVMRPLDAKYKKTAINDHKINISMNIALEYYICSILVLYCPTMQYPLAYTYMQVSG